MANGTRWRVITPALLAELPEQPGIFEVGNLVRSILFIGAASGSLAEEIRRILVEPRMLSRAHCIRFEAIDEAEEVAQQRLAAYRREHAGALPYAQRQDAFTNLIEGKRPTARALPLARPGRKAGPASFLRSAPSAS